MPKIIQSLWIGPRLSAMEQLCIKSYLHHGHPFHLYVYESVEGVPSGTDIRDANEIVPKSRIFTYANRTFGNGSYAGFADVFRYRLLLAKGNWWVDTDSICLKPFDFADEYVFSSEWSPAPLNQHPNCGNLKAPKGSELYAWLCAQTERVNPGMRWGQIGPALMKQGIEKFGLERYVQPPAAFCPVRYDAGCTGILGAPSAWEPNGSYAVHLWNEAFRANGIDKNKPFPEHCVFERLKRQYAIA